MVEDKFKHLKVSKQLHLTLKKKSLENEKSLQDFVKDIIEKGLKE